MANAGLASIGYRGNPEYTGAGDHAVPELSHDGRCPDFMGAAVRHVGTDWYCPHCGFVGSDVVDDNVQQMEARMKIYLSGSFNARDIIEQYAAVLIERGHEVTSNWLWEPPKRVGDEFEEWEFRARVNDDILDVQRSDTIVCFTEVPLTSGGRMFELGYATALGKELIVVGKHKAVFHYLAEMKQYDTWEDFLCTIE